MATRTAQAQADEELAVLSRDYPEWRLWHGRDGHGQLRGWHATRQANGRSVLLAADGPAQLRQRLEHATEASRV
jgi:hypothetical protein